MFPVIAGVASAFLIVCCISAVVVLTKLFEVTTTDNSRQIEIPEFVGTVWFDGLEAQLESNIYNVEIEYIYDAKYDRNMIVAQDPLPGEKRKIIPDKQKCDLTLTVCWGAETCELPDYAYKDARDAEIELKNLGLIPKVVKQTHEFLSEGYVIRTDPVPDTTLKVGDIVTLYVSSGQDVKYVEMPDFEGKTEEEVMKALGWNKLELGNVEYEYSDTVPVGRVIRQSRAVGAQTPEGSKIDFVMSKGPEPVETAAPEPELPPEITDGE